MADQTIQGAGIKIENLYKIFGSRGSAYVEAVKNGMTKTELLSTESITTRLASAISISICPRVEFRSVLGLSGSGKSTLIRHINRLIDPTAGEVSHRWYARLPDERKRFAPISAGTRLRWFFRSLHCCPTAQFIDNTRLLAWKSKVFSPG